MSSENLGQGPVSPYGDLSRRARRELEALGINVEDAIAEYNETGAVSALTGAIPIVPLAPVVSQPSVIPATPQPPTLVSQSSPFAPPVAVPVYAPVPTPGIFPETISRRDEVLIEQRKTAEIPVTDAAGISDLEDFVEIIEEEIVPIDLEPVEQEAVRIDQREDHDEITNEFEPFTITTTSTGVIPTTSHALVLPTLPEDDPLVIAAMNQTGEIVITGQITLPVGIAQVGADTASLDTSELDLIIEDDEVGSGQDLAPVSASQAVSAFTGAAISVTMPKRTNEKLPVILAISAAVLALGVVGLFVANYFLRVF